jgi:hypothetical protein
MPDGKRSASWWIVRTIKLLLYLCLALGPFVFEHRETLFEANVCHPKEQLFADFVLGAPFGYRLLTQAGYRNPNPHFVQLVTIAEGREPNDLFDTGTQNRCRRRLFLTKIIAEIQAQHPALIVIDYSFPPRGCIEDEQLRHMISNSPVPIVFGIQTETMEEYKNFSGHTLAQPTSNDRSCLVQTAAVDIRPATANNIATGGLVRLDKDPSKIPLSWPVNLRNPDDTLGPVATVQTLSLVAAGTYEQLTGHTLDERLRNLLDKKKNPYTSFLPTTTIPESAAIDILCAPGSFQGTDWDKCAPHSAAHKLFASPIVLIGERSRRDWHDSPMGGVPGSVLQANYIESLLEDRYLSPVSRNTTLVMNILWIVLVECLFAFFRPWKALGFSMIGNLLLIGACYVMILQWGYFLSLWVLGLGFALPILRMVEEARHGLAHDETAVKTGARD